MGTNENINLGISSDVQKALSTLTHVGWLNWIGDIPLDHVASTVAAIAREQLLLTEARELMDRRDCFRHPTIQHFIDRYKIVQQTEDCSEHGLKEAMLEHIVSFSIAYTHARKQLLSDIRFLEGELPLEILQDEMPLCCKENNKLQDLRSLLDELLRLMKLNMLPEEFLRRVAAYIPQISLTREVVSSGDVSQFTELYELLISAILDEEAEENAESMHRYQQQLYQSYSLLSPTERSDLLEGKQKEVDKKDEERKKPIRQLSVLSFDIQHLPRDFLDEHKRLDREQEQRRVKNCHDAGVDYDPSLLKGVGTMYDPEISDEEFTYLLSTEEKDHSEILNRLEKARGELKESIRNLTITINKLELQCEVLSLFEH